MWNYDRGGKLWSGTPSTTSGDGQQWDGKWHDADLGLRTKDLVRVFECDELGQSARSYLRQIEAWVRITRAPSSQQALLLYQNLQGRAWVEAEELDVKELCEDGGVERFKAWISERYLEIEVGKIAEALYGFFKRMKRGANLTHGWWR